jgi:hypothetical protein
LPAGYWEKKVSKRFFFEKKNRAAGRQKTFGPAGFGTFVACARRRRSFFGYFFFKKSNILLLKHYGGDDGTGCGD